ncbi:hypothetical protein GUJ93_ZPchr0011g28747 [Zizania palustris]|uniref:Chalcone synthase n=1 Tax=Zizania palustris TaxID=103762 RepID=A0A8J5WF72_ZIZPA|nr:hypothetical protein GUJ93_ZPchr0011g28747 [Zizania palustris]
MAMAPSPPPETVLDVVRADGPAAVLGIGTAIPANCVTQDEYPDWYFRVTESEHLTKLKAKMRRICDKTDIKKRHFYHSEEMIAGHPELFERARPSLGTRLGVAEFALPELAVAAAATAVAEWGRPAADITHLVVGTNAGASAPGADLRMAALLGLRPTVQRTIIYLRGCSAGYTALRVAKDIAENNRGARVLVAGADITLPAFTAPDEADLDALIVMAVFGDGAGAAVVGADPILPIEHPIFQMVSVSQTTIAGTEHKVSLQLRERGLGYKISGEVQALVRDNVEQCLVDALMPLGLTGDGDWNHLFWAMHPGGRAVLDSYEAALRLNPQKLAASRRVLREYGNTSSAAIFFVLDELRRRRHDRDGERCEWGAMVGLAPGLTIETMVLRATTGGRDE